MFYNAGTGFTKRILFSALFWNAPPDIIVGVKTVGVWNQTEFYIKI